MSKPPCPGVIVIVEDEEDTRELLGQILEAKGHAVVMAEDGIGALALLQSIPHVCLVLLDLVMPRMDGLALLAGLGADPRLSLLRVCFTTSATERVPVGLPCLPKPVDLRRLYEMVDEHCDHCAA